MKPCEMCRGNGFIEIPCTDEDAYERRCESCKATGFRRSIDEDLLTLRDIEPGMGYYAGNNNTNLRTYASSIATAVIGGLR